MRRIADFAGNHHGVFRLADARQVGIADATVQRAARRREIERLSPGIFRFTAVPAGWSSSLLAACWAGGPEAVASHRAAAWLHELPGGSRAGLEICCRRWRRTRCDGLVVHESLVLDPWDTAIVQGIPVTSVERTLLDLAGVLSPRMAEGTLENALHRELVTIPGLNAMLGRLARSGRPGVRTLRRLVQARMETGVRPTESVAETRVLQIIHRSGLAPPVTQYDVVDRGVWIARVDFAYVEARIAIEYDSDAFHTGRVASLSDSRRRHRLTEAGWLPIVATVNDLRDDGHHLMRAVASALAGRTRDFGVKDRTVERGK